MNTQTHYEINEATRFGGFWIRVGASFIDMVVLLIPVLLISFLFRAVTPATDEMEIAVVELMGAILNIIVYWIYFAALHSSSWQASVGKKVVNLKVVDKNGNRISFGRATGRYFASFISALILGIGYMMVGWTKRKQGLHDMMAGTLVIKIENT
ncbi:RDD family protein [Candidatus Thiosymbion oneisti]|uniref:RDD family protein n=1 Tax=Candidatus Thiosymbion oneisti TaxID=589554 RepID=UPI00105D1510|nr:RDD family protein [Candidatus Thiosymbion oneisti]